MTLVNELIEMEAITIKAMNVYSSLAIEYAGKCPEVSDMVHRWCNQEERMVKELHGSIAKLLADDNTLDFLEESNIKALDNALYLKSIYVYMKKRERIESRKNAKK